MPYIRKKFIEILEKAIEEGKKMTREEKLFTYDGIVYPTTLCSSELFKALESFEARSDDVILAAYCKTGTNWVGQIVTDLVITSAKKHEPHKLNEELLLAEFPFLEIGDLEKYKRMKTYPSRRVIFTHLRADKLPKSVFKNKAKNTALGAKKIAKFFELNLSEEDIQGVAERSTFKTMKDNSKKTHGEFGDVLFRKGGVSDWKTLFSQKNNQEMDMVFKERLAGTKVGAMIKYDVYCKA